MSARETRAMAKRKQRQLDRKSVNRILDKAAASTTTVTRKVTLRYVFENEDSIKRISNWYRRDVQLSAILRLFNGARTRETIALCDLYTILYNEAKAGRIKQRKAHLEFELMINEFVHVYKLWRSGSSQHDILKLSEASQIGIMRAIRSLMLRYYDEQKKLGLIENANATDLLARGHIGTHEGRPALIIFRDDVPTNLMEFFALYDLENAEDTGVAADEFGNLSSGNELGGIEGESDVNMVVSGHTKTHAPGEANHHLTDPANPHGVHPRGDTSGGAGVHDDSPDDPIQDIVTEAGFLSGLDATVPIYVPTAEDDFTADEIPQASDKRRKKVADPIITGQPTGQPAEQPAAKSTPERASQPGAAKPSASDQINDLFG